MCLPAQVRNEILIGRPFARVSGVQNKSSDGYSYELGSELFDQIEATCALTALGIKKYKDLLDKPLPPGESVRGFKLCA